MLLVLALSLALVATWRTAAHRPPLEAGSSAWHPPDVTTLTDGFDETRLLLRRSPGSFGFSLQNSGRASVTLLGAGTDPALDEEDPRYDLRFEVPGDAFEGYERTDLREVVLAPGATANVFVTVTAARCATRDGSADPTQGGMVNVAEYPTLPLRVRYLGVTTTHHHLLRLPLAIAPQHYRPGVATLCAGVPAAKSPTMPIGG